MKNFSCPEGAAGFNFTNFFYFSFQMALAVRMHFSIQPNSFIKTRKTNQPIKKYHTRRNYQTRKNYPGKKKFHYPPAKYFHFKKLFQEVKKV